VKYLRTKEGKKRTNLVELTNKRRGIDKIFGNEDYAIKYIQSLESSKVEQSALAGKGAPTLGKSAILSAGKDLIAAKELAGDFDTIDNENQ
jgi:hypothetical protein